MANESFIKWHAQELHTLLEQELNDITLAQLRVRLEATVLNNPRFENIVAVPPADTGGTGGANPAEPISPG
ncbi:MAG: hypothetical protein ACYS1A_08975 [Planctomycetota bacterium]|jgi:hypothetical protein